MPRSEYEVQDFPFVIDYQMQFESEEPSHGTFPPTCKPFKGFMHMDTLVAAYTQGSTVNETYTCAFSQQYLLDEDCQLQKDLLFQFHKTNRYS
jgi:hypothetical protein